ncbi:hypothetical protein KI614_06795 [Dechloromonas denitrificans]|uniref:3'-5' exonuclease n=1 Tax=Dechloromonas denitrificans TaxID=281362 RepID=UPI001CF8016F|nr:hypothetical protein [Dechloromonas denitrificans]UCV12910.1 hypothetical protein KI614_06795 [Dechloromonas denitrificans]
MISLKKFLFKAGSLEHLPEDVRLSLEKWRASKPPELDEVHFHTRYIVIDIVTSGTKPESDRLLSIAATCVRQGVIVPEDSLFIDLASLEQHQAATDEGLEQGAAVDRQLMAFLQFAAKAPLVTYHVSYVGGFLQQLFKERLGVDFQPQWVDMAWLLPAMFAEKSHSIMPLDQWLDAFGFASGVGRRDAMDNTLMLARLFQMLLVRAADKDIDTALRLVEESRASSFLRRTH